MANETRTALEVVRHTAGRELATSAATEQAAKKIEAMCLLARRFPRDEGEAAAALLESSERFSFADASIYEFPRGKTTVHGLSVYFAREAARRWRNVQVTSEIVGEDDDGYHLRAAAWDLETNLTQSADDYAKKRIQRIDKKTGETQWISVTDERELRELVNRRLAVLERNVVLRLLPEETKEACLATCIAAKRRGPAKPAPKPSGAKAPAAPAAAVDEAAALEGLRTKTLDAFAGLAPPVSRASLEWYVGRPWATATADDISSLRAIYRAIADGEATWEEYRASRQNDVDRAAAAASSGPDAPAEPPRVSGETFSQPRATQSADGKLFPTGGGGHAG